MSAVMPLFADTGFLAFDVGVDCQAAAKTEFRIFCLDLLVAFEGVGIFLLCVVDVCFLEEDAGYDLRIAVGD